MSLIIYLLISVAICCVISGCICYACCRSKNCFTSDRSRPQVLSNPSLNMLPPPANFHDPKEQLNEGDINTYLPVVNMQTAEGQGTSDREPSEQCMICLEPRGSEPVRVVVFCGHKFHSKCLLEWAKVKCFCPMCKQDFSKKYILQKANTNSNQVNEISPLSQHNAESGNLS